MRANAGARSEISVASLCRLSRIHKLPPNSRYKYTNSGGHLKIKFMDFQFSWDSQQGRLRTTSILVRTFWNFKCKVLKYSRNCSLHNTLIPNLVKPLMYIHIKKHTKKKIFLSITIYNDLSNWYFTVSFHCYRISKTHTITQAWPLLMLWYSKTCFSKFSISKKTSFMIQDTDH